MKKKEFIGCLFITPFSALVIWVAVYCPIVFILSQFFGFDSCNFTIVLIGGISLSFEITGIFVYLTRKGYEILDGEG